MSAVLPLWPCAVPACVLRDAWALEPEDPNLRTEMDGGAVAVEARFSRVRTILPHAWRLTRDQFEIFKGFWSRDLDRGRLWFEAPLFDGRCAQRRRVRFEGAWRAAAIDRVWLRLEGKLEIADLPQASAEDQEALAVGALLGDVDAYAAELEEILQSLPGGAP